MEASPAAAVDDWPAHDLPDEIPGSPSGGPERSEAPGKLSRASRSKRPRTRSRKAAALNKPGLVFPQWFTRPRNQAAAELIAFSVALDALVGREPSLDRWPYSAFDPGVVAAFLARLTAEAWAATIPSTIASPS